MNQAAMPAVSFERMSPVLGSNTSTPFTFTRMSSPPSSRISTSGSPNTTNMLPRPVFLSSSDMCMSGLIRAFRILRLPRLASSEEWASKLKAQAISTSNRIHRLAGRGDEVLAADRAVLRADQDGGAPFRTVLAFDEGAAGADEVAGPGRQALEDD